MRRLPPSPTRTDTRFPYTTLFRSRPVQGARVFSDPQPRVLDRIVREGLSAFVDEVDVDGHQEQVGSGVNLENDLRAGHIGEDQELAVRLVHAGARWREGLHECVGLFEADSR